MCIRDRFYFETRGLTYDLLLDTNILRNCFSFPIAVRDLILCNGIKNKEYNVWQSLPQYYLVASGYQSIKKDLLMAMGCSQSIDILKE